MGPNSKEGRVYFLYYCMYQGNTYVAAVGVVGRLCLTKKIGGKWAYLFLKDFNQKNIHTIPPYSVLSAVLPTSVLVKTR